MASGGGRGVWTDGGKVGRWGGEINPDKRVFVATVLKAVYEG